MSVRGRTEAFFGSISEYGKSPCFLRLGFLESPDLDCLGYVSDVVNMSFFLECARLHE
jgi:hypothetical protein